MPSPVYLTTDDYPAIRRLLGMDGADVTTLSNAAIEDRPYLLRVEREVGPLLTAASVVMDDADVAYDEDTAEWVREGLQYLVAGRLALLWRWPAQGGEIRSEDVGGVVKVAYRSGLEWRELADKLIGLGVRALAEALGADAGAVDPSRAMPTCLVVRGGPTRAAAATLAGGRTIEDMLQAVIPNLLGGAP